MNLNFCFQFVANINIFLFLFKTLTLIYFAIHIQVFMLHNLRSGFFVLFTREQLISNQYTIYYYVKIL